MAPRPHHHRREATLAGEVPTDAASRPKQRQLSTNTLNTLNAAEGTDKSPPLHFCTFALRSFRPLELLSAATRLPCIEEGRDIGAIHAAILVGVG